MSHVRRFDNLWSTVARLGASVDRLQARLERQMRPVPLPRARMQLTADQEVNPFPTLHPVEWESAVYNVGGMWSDAEPTRLTAPVAGVYYVSMGVVFQDFANPNDLLIGIRVNGDDSHAGYVVVDQGQVERAPQANVGVDTLLDAGDYIEGIVRHYEGGARDLLASRRTFLTARWVTPAAETDGIDDLDDV